MKINPTSGKKLLFPLLSIFLVFQSYYLVVALVHSTENNFSVFEIGIIGFTLNLFITGIFAFPGFVFPTNKILGTNYYQIKHPNAVRIVYNVLRIDIFRKLLLFFIWGRGKNRAKYFNGTRKGLANFSYQSKQSEFGHLMALICVAIATGILVIDGYYKIALSTSVVNLFGNFYPVVLQRYHRIRIDKVLKR